MQTWTHPLSGGSRHRPKGGAEMRSDARAWMVLVFLAFSAVLLALTPAVSSGEEHREPPSFTAIDREVQQIKQEILDINREVSVLEEELLFPPERRLTVFLSVDKGTKLDLESLKIELNGETVAQQHYSDAEMQALRQGGAHKPYIGDIQNGDYVLKAHLRGVAARDRVFDLATTVTFQKRKGTKYVELQVSESRFRRIPEFTARLW